MRTCMRTEERECGSARCGRTRGEHQLTPVYEEAVLGAVARDASIDGFTISCGKLSFSSATSCYPEDVYGGASQKCEEDSHKM